MKPHWGQVLAVFAAVVVVGVVTVLLVANTESEPGAGFRPTGTAAPTATTKRTAPVTRGTMPIAPPSTRRQVDSGCRIGQGPSQVADVPQQVTDRVNRAWERIERWLAAKAPKTAATLAPPATPAQISEAQRQTGVPFPAELVAFLRRHNGVDTGVRGGFTLPPFYDPMSTTGIVSDAKVMCEVLGTTTVDADFMAAWWHGQVVPFARDGSGGNLVLDQRPGRNGRLGDHSEESEMGFDRYPPTLVELLEVTATSLETGGRALGHYRPRVVEGGALDWDIVS